uniref:ANK_REP_REGION domain-containing protein n=1 Tax=Angiostrongylus cantonensis TaxID=6313 RepID=A0A0K0DGN7_ANGCA
MCLYKVYRLPASIPFQIITMIFIQDIQMEHLSQLLQQSSSPEMAKEALLIAICIGSRPLVELILTVFQEFPHEERSGCSNSPAFLPHMTPLMLACILNNFAIVQCLLLRGHTIDIPHHSGCELISPLYNFSLNNSEAFLWLATDDPFAAACSLAQDIETCMENDNFEFMVGGKPHSSEIGDANFQCTPTPPKIWASRRIGRMLVTVVSYVVPKSVPDSQFYFSSIRSGNSFFFRVLSNYIPLQGKAQVYEL